MVAGSNVCRPSRHILMVVVRAKKHKKLRDDDSDDDDIVMIIIIYRNMLDLIFVKVESSSYIIYWEYHQRVDTHCSWCTLLFFSFLETLWSWYHFSNYTLIRLFFLGFQVQSVWEGLCLQLGEPAAFLLNWDEYKRTQDGLMQLGFGYRKNTESSTWSMSGTEWDEDVSVAGVLLAPKAKQQTILKTILLSPVFRWSLAPYGVQYGCS